MALQHHLLREVLQQELERRQRVLRCYERTNSVIVSLSRSMGNQL